MVSYFPEHASPDYLSYLYYVFWTYVYLSRQYGSYIVFTWLYWTLWGGFYQFNCGSHVEFLNEVSEYKLGDCLLCDVFQYSLMLEDRNDPTLDTISSEYHKIRFKTHYYNGYSQVRALNILLNAVRDPKGRIPVEDQHFLSEPLETITLYEFLLDETIGVSTSRLRIRILKTIADIYYYHGTVDTQYIVRRFKRPLESARALLIAWLSVS